MFLWRISNYSTLDGVGGTLRSARWHTKGRPVVYTADHPASALLEILASMDGSLLPDIIQLLKIEVPSHVEQRLVHAGVALPNDVAVSRSIGDQWLAKASSALLQVPSAILPDIFNTLINPAHPDSQLLKIMSVQSVPLDARLQ